VASQQPVTRSPAEIKAEIRVLNRLQIRFGDHVEGATWALEWVLGEGQPVSKTLGDTIETLGRLHGDKPSKGK